MTRTEPVPGGHSPLYAAPPREDDDYDSPLTNPTGTSSSPFSSSGRRRTQPGYAAILTGPYRGSDAFWEVKRLIRKDKKRPAAMSEVEKAEMPFVIAELLREGAITEEDLSDFSAKLR